MSRIKTQIIINIIWSGIATFLKYLISFLLTPIVTKELGIEAYGFIGLANTFITYIDLIAVALNAFAARYIALSYHNGDYDTANKYYNSVLVSDIIFVLIMFLPCTVMIYKLEKLLTIPERLVFDVKILFILLLTNYAVNIIGTVFVASAFIKNKTSITSRNKGINTLVYAGVIYLLFMLFKLRLYYIAFANLCATIVAFILNYCCSRKLTPELRVKVKDFSFQNVKKVLASGIWNSINNIGNVLNSGLDLLVTNKLLSAIVMGQISVSKQLSAIMTTVTMLIIQAFQPKQLEAYAKGDINGVERYLLLAMKVSGVIGSVFFITFFCMGKQFLNVWLPGQDIFYIFNLSIIVLIGDIVVIVVRPLYYVYTLTDKLKKVFWITVIMGIVNVVSMLVLIPMTKFGGYVVVGTTTVLNLLIQFWVAPRLASQFLNIRDVFSPIIYRHILTCIIGTAFFKMVTYKIYCNTWIDFFVWTGIIGTFIMFFCMFAELGKRDLLELIKWKQ